MKLNIKEYLIFKIKSYIKQNPLIVFCFFCGLFVGNYISFIVTWIPLFGGILGSFITIGGGILGVMIAKKFKKEKK